MPIPADQWAKQAWREAHKWRQAASQADVEWMDRWYRQNGPSGLWRELDQRFAQCLELLELPATSWRARLRRMPDEERRIVLLCCIRQALIGWTLLDMLSSAGISGPLRGPFLLRQAAQTASQLVDDHSDPWPFSGDPLEAAND